MDSPLSSNYSSDTEGVRDRFEARSRAADNTISSPSSPSASSEDFNVSRELNNPGTLNPDGAGLRPAGRPNHPREDQDEGVLGEGLGGDIPRGPTHGVRPVGLKFHDTPGDSPSLDKDVLDLAKRSFIPLPLNASLSKLPPGVSEREVPCIPRIHFQYGLSLPFPPLFLEVFHFYSMAPAQLHPNGVVLILAFLLNCARCHVPPSLLLFRSFYALRKAHASFPGVFSFTIRSGMKDFILNKPRSAKGYLAKGFFMCDARVYPMPPWNDSLVPEDRKPLTNLPDIVISDHSLLSLSPLSTEDFFKTGNSGYYWPRGIYPAELFTLPRIAAVWPDGVQPTLYADATPFDEMPSGDSSRQEDLHPGMALTPEQPVAPPPGPDATENPGFIPQKVRQQRPPSQQMAPGSSPTPGRKSFIRHPTYSGGASSRPKRPLTDNKETPPHSRQRVESAAPPPPPPPPANSPLRDNSQAIPEREETTTFADALLADSQLADALNRTYSKYSAGLFAKKERELRDAREKLAGQDDLEAQLKASQKKLAEKEKKLAEKEKKLAEVEKKYTSLKKEKKDAQLDALNAIVQKVLHSADFDERLEGIAAAASEDACHEMYRSLRGWLPGPARLEAQASYYRPKASDLLNHRWRSLQEANLEGLVPRLWESLKMSSRAPSASDIKKIKLKEICEASYPDPGPESFNAYGVVPETPHWAESYQEYCAIPDNYGYQAVEVGTGEYTVGLPRGQDDLLYQSRKSIRKVGFPERPEDESRVDAPAYCGPSWSDADVAELERRWRRAHATPGEENPPEDNVFP